MLKIMILRPQEQSTLVTWRGGGRERERDYFSAEAHRLTSAGALQLCLHSKQESTKVSKEVSRG